MALGGGRARTPPPPGGPGAAAATAAPWRAAPRRRSAAPGPRSAGACRRSARPPRWRGAGSRRCPTRGRPGRTAPPPGSSRRGWRPEASVAAQGEDAAGQRPGAAGDVGHGELGGLGARAGAWPRSCGSVSSRERSTSADGHVGAVERREQQREPGLELLGPELAGEEAAAGGVEEGEDGAARGRLAAGAGRGGRGRLPPGRGPPPDRRAGGRPSASRVCSEQLRRHRARAPPLGQPGLRALVFRLEHHGNETNHGSDRVSIKCANRRLADRVSRGRGSYPPGRRRTAAEPAGLRRCCRLRGYSHGQREARCGSQLAGRSRGVAAEGRGGGTAPGGWTRGPGPGWPRRHAQRLPGLRRRRGGGGTGRRRAERGILVCGSGVGAAIGGQQGRWESWPGCVTIRTLRTRAWSMTR